MNTENTSIKRRSVPPWRQWLLWPAAVFVLIYATQLLWLPMLVQAAMQRARSPGVSLSEKRREWDFIRRRAINMNDQQLLQTVATDTTAPGGVSGTAWASIAKHYQENGDAAKAAECYLCALDRLVSDSGVTGVSTNLRYEVWNQVRFQLGGTVDPERYRAVLISWAERVDYKKDHALEQQLVFEIGKMKLLAGAGNLSKEARP
jgi:hypothetical protein